MEKVEVKIVRPFGPSVVIAKIPPNTIEVLNNYIDTLIGDEQKIKQLDHGNKLVGDVTQEFKLEEEILQKSGWRDFLKNYVSKWIEIDSAYINMVQPMVDVYRGSAKLNFNGNPWKNKNFQSKYSDLTWRGLYDYVKYFTELYNDIGYEEGERVLDSLNNRFDQMRDDLIIWKEIED